MATVHGMEHQQPFAVNDAFKKCCFRSLMCFKLNILSPALLYSAIMHPSSN